MRRVPRAAVSAAIAAAAALLSIAFGATASARPPTAGQIERATDRFLAATPSPRTGGTPAPPGTAELFPGSRVVA